MNIKNILIGGIVGGIAFFLLGWLIYGIVLMDYMMSVSPYIKGLYREEADMVLWAMFVSNLCYAIMMAYVFDKGKVSGWMNGLQSGAILGFLITVAFDSGNYALTNMVSKKGMMLDVVASTVMTAVVGAIIVMLTDMMNKKAA